MTMQQEMITQTVWNGVAAWELRTQQAVARISCFGGQLLSWQPQGHGEVLWCSGQLQPPRALRGGVPLCWPWFGPHPSDAAAPAHGLARTASWQLDHIRQLDDGRVALSLSPTQSLHPALRIQQQIVVGQVLEHSITSYNISDEVQRLSQALHGYWAVEDVAAVRLHGLEGCEYLDALAPGQPRRQQGAWHSDPSLLGGRCDRIYQKVGGPVVLEDRVTGRRLQLQAAAGCAVVVWTPGQTLGLQMADVGVQWPHYLCVEVANAGSDEQWLVPGQVHTLGQVVQLL